MEALSNEVIDALLASQVRSVRKVIQRTCDNCGSDLSMGYCSNSDCPVNGTVDTYECEYCGHCENPAKCVWSVTCPNCGAGPSSQCTRPGGLVGLHSERWALASKAA